MGIFCVRSQENSLVLHRLSEQDLRMGVSLEERKKEGEIGVLVPQILGLS